MIHSPKLLEYLRWWEGLPGGKPALRAYQDEAGRWTLGYGRARGVSQGDTCTVDVAESWLLREVFDVERAVKACFIEPKFLQHQLDGLTAFVYNIGITAFRTSSPRIMVSMGKFDRVGSAMELWNKTSRYVKDPVTGEEKKYLVVSPGLVKRRAADRAIFERGDYSARP